MKLRKIILEMPGGGCPGCKNDIIDWHVEWLAAPDRGPVFRGKAAIDCPLCGTPVLTPNNREVIELTDPEQLVRKRSRAVAEVWARGQTPPISLDDFLKTPEGSQYKDYEFGP